MEKRGTIVAMIVAVTLIVLWTPLTNWLGKRAGWDMTTPIATADADNKNQTPSTLPTSQQAMGMSSSQPTTLAGGLSVAATSQPVAGVELGSGTEDDAQFVMLARTTPVGAGIESITLNKFKKQIKSADLFTFQQPYQGYENESRPLATRSLTIDGNVIDLSATPWSVEQSSPTSVAYSTTINAAAGPLAKITKTLTLDKASDPSQGYEITVTHNVINLTGQPHTISLQYNGTVDPPREQDRGGERQTLAGYTVRSAIEVVHDAIESYTESVKAKEYVKDKQGNPVVWAGTMSSYFQALVRPLPYTDNANAPVTGPANYLKDVTANAVGITPEQHGEDRQISFTFTTVPLQLQPNGTIPLQAKAFFGPRQRKLLNSDYYAAYPIDYAASLVLTSGPCGICTFQWLVDLLVNLLRAFHFVARDWGLAIILLVCLVRTILHPITKRSQISMSRMSKMGPEMAKIRERFKDDKEQLQKAMWEAQKQQGVGPYLGCAPMFLQMPIWIALWQALYTTFELRQAPFLWGFTWIHDLSKPDHLLTWTPIPLVFGFSLSAINILPILMGVVMYFQMKLQPKPAAMTPEQEQQQKMMQFISPLLFPVMLYNGPSGLNLYIMTSTFIGIIESKIVRDHIKQREEAEKAGVVIVDAGKKFGGKPGTVSRVQPSPTEKPTGVMGWLQQLQERAEQLRRDADKRK